MNHHDSKNKGVTAIGHFILQSSKKTLHLFNPTHTPKTSERHWAHELFECPIYLKKYVGGKKERRVENKNIKEKKLKKNFNGEK